MVERLVRRQFAQRRQDAERIAGQEEDVPRMTAAPREHRTGDVVERIAGAGILGDLIVVVIGSARRRVENDVFQYGAEPERIPDLRLARGRQADGLGVAAPFEIEDAMVRPAMLIIANEAALGIGRERGLAGAGEPEKKSGASVSSHIGGTVHGQDAPLRQEIIQKGEYGFLDLPGIMSARDDDQAALETQSDAGVAAGAVAIRVEEQVRSGEYRELGLECMALRRRGPYQEAMREQG